MFKCKDAKGKITYSGMSCELIGQESAGEVTGKASVAPAYKPPPGADKPAAGDKSTGKPPPEKPAPSAASQSPAKPPAEPERKCFVVKTAKGNVVRCNEKSEEEESGGKKE